MGEGAPSDSPTLADFADDVLVRHPSIAHEHLVEGRVVVHLQDRPGFDTLLAHVEKEVRDARVLRDIPVGAGHEDRHVGVIGRGVPDLLTVDDPLVAVARGRGLEPGEIGTGAGFC